jgi:uncharacterized Tic20 family protein
VRIQANPASLSTDGLTLEDVRTAVAASNVNAAKGSFDGREQAFTIGADDRLLSSDQYRPLIIAYRNGAPIRLSDVATVVDGVENVKQAAWMNTQPAVIVNVQRQPGANVIVVADRVKALLPQFRSLLPPGVQVSILTDRTNTIRASVRDVQFELMLTIALVVLVIFLFLRTLSATVIPSVAVPLSLVGTFGVMYLLGYSLNNLTLMALTISTGFVVDDAIVMIENITRYIEDGVPPLEAALKGSERDRVHRRIDQPVARRRVHSDPSDGWHCRTPVSRGGGHGDGSDHGLDGSLADDHSDDVRAASPFRQIAIAWPDSCNERARLRVGTRALRTGASRGSAPPAGGAGPDARDYGGDCLSLPADSERILPAAGYGEPGGVHSGRSIDVVSGHATARRSVR